MTQPSVLINQSVVTAVRASVSTRTADVSARISSLSIATNDDYLSADVLLVEIRQARKLAESIFADKIRSPILAPMRKALARLYALESELSQEPFDAAEKAVK